MIPKGREGDLGQGRSGVVEIAKSWLTDIKVELDRRNKLSSEALQGDHN